MHLTLKQEATRPPGMNSLQKQARFDAFTAEFNTRRPHEALSMKCPADLYTPSSRPDTGLPDIAYPLHDRDVLVTACGRLCLHRKKINISTVFAGRRFRPCTTDSRHDLPIAPNLLRQEFMVSVPNTVWLADITYLPTGEGWLYLAAVLDLATRKVVGWSMRDHMRTELTTAALMMASQRQRPPAGLVCHSDRGIQYAAEAYRKQLAGMRALPSMSRTACCYDNAPMKSFFHTLKVELVYQRRWAIRDEA